MRIPDGLRLEDEAEGYAQERAWRATGTRPRKSIRWALVLVGALVTIGGLLSPSMLSGPGAIIYLPNPAAFIGVAMSAIGLYWLTKR